MSIISTGFKLPTSIISNASGVAGWTDPSNILLVDDQFAVSAGPTNILTVGNFNHNIPQGSTILNITLRVKGYRGSFNTTLNLYAIDDTTGVEFSYPYNPPFQGFSGTNTLYTLLPTLFATVWTVDQANNIKLKLIADGELHMDSVEIDITYNDNVAPSPTPTTTGQVVCDEFIQAQPFKLSRAMTSADTVAFLTSFNYPSPTGSGDPILLADAYGDLVITIDQGKPTEENCLVTGVDHNYQGTGLVRLSFTNITNRGLDFKYPYTNDITKVYNHSGTAEVVISNSAPFYDRFLKKCQIDALVSAPIGVADEGVTITNHAHKFNFTGNGVQASIPDPVNFPDDVEVNIPGGGTTPPVVVSTSSATSGNIQVPTLTWQHNSSGLDRLLVVQVSTEEASIVTGITFNGIPLTQQVVDTDVPNNLRTEQWSLVAPPVGAYNIVVSLAPNAYISAGAESYVSVDQANPIGNSSSATGNSNIPSVINTTANDNSLVADSIVTALTPITYSEGSAQTLNWSHTANTDTRQGASSVESAGTAPDNITMDYIMTQITDWVMTALEINGLPGTASTDELVKVSAADTAPGYLQPKINVHSGDGSVTVVTSITNPGANEILDIDLTTAGGGGGGAVNMQIDQTPDNGTFGLLAGAVDGINTTFTVSQGAYQASKLIVYLNGLAQEQGALQNYVETNPPIGTFDFNTPPNIGDVITAEYQTTSTPAQTGIQFEDEGVNLGTSGTVDEVDFTGIGVSATRVGNKVTVNIPGSGSDAEKKVGVGSTSDINWFNIQYPFSAPSGSISDYCIWDLNNAGTQVSPSFNQFGTSDYIKTNGTNYDSLLPDLDTADGLLRFDAGKQTIFQTLFTPTTIGPGAAGIGFDAFGTSNIIASQGTVNLSIGFVRKAADGSWYTRCADGIGFTENSIAFVAFTKYVLRVEYDPANATPQVRFYVNGILVDTITTNIPTTSTGIIGFSAGNDVTGGIFQVTCPSFSVEI